MVTTRHWISTIACSALAGFWLAAGIPADAAAQSAPAAKPAAKPTAKPTAKPGGKPSTRSATKPAPKAAAVSAPADDPAKSDAAALAGAYNAAGQELFKLIAVAPGNIVLSPYSIGTAMAMATSGARGKTEAEMRAVLKFVRPQAAIETANAEVMALLNSYGATPPACPAGLTLSGARCETPPSADQACPPGAQLEGSLCVSTPVPAAVAKLLIANALMLTKGGALVSEDFIKLLQDKFAAELFKDATLDSVNAWVKQKTEDKIPKLLDQLDPQSIAVLLNAVYFKASWRTAFNKNVTIEGDFNLSAKEKVPVPLMRRSGNFALVAGAGFRAIRLPYSVTSLGMIVVLPEEIEGVRKVTDALTAAELGRVLAELRSAPAKSVDLALPRFAANSKSDLIGAFQKLGMNVPFVANSADFSGLTGKPPGNPPIAIGQIVHSAVVDVNEEGTEAAAATAVEMVARSAAPRQAEQFRVDRPFLFYIVDDKTEVILFQGRVVDPRG